MRRWERWTFNVLSLVVAASGFAYLWMKNFIVNDDPFALVNHPWQSTILQAHVLVSPPLILIFGVILNSHIMKKLRATGIPNRRSGLLSLAAFGTMVCSGYLLQVTTSEVWLTALVWGHVAGGILFTLSYGSHLVISAVMVRRKPAASPIREVA